MALFIISYDLRSPNDTFSDYEALGKFLSGLGAARVQESVWGLRSSESAEEIHDQVRKRLYTADRLLVAEIDDYKNTKGLSLLKNL